MKTLVVLPLFMLVGCSSPQTATRTERDITRGQRAEAEGNIPVARYFASLEGDFQSGYQVDRQVADSRLAELEAQKPTPADPDAYLEYLSVLDAAGRHADAAKKIRSFIAENPTDKRPVFLLAVHFWRTQKKEMAAYLFNQLEKEPSFPWKSLLYNNLGMTALTEKNRPLAISYFDKATKATPATPAPFVNLGALYLQSRSFSAAEPLFAKARSLDDDFEDASMGLAVALEGQGKFAEAHGVYADFMSEHPNALSLVYNDSLLLGNRLSRKEEAAQQMLRYIQRGGKETARAQEIIQSWR